MAYNSDRRVANRGIMKSRRGTCTALSLTETPKVGLPSLPPTDRYGSVDILGVQVSSAPFEQTAHRIVELASGDGNVGGSPYVCATSVHGLIVASEDPKFRDILNRATIVTADGMPLAWFGRLSKQRGMERVYGPDLMLRVCELSADRGLRHFFYGGDESVADDLAQTMVKRFPGLRVAGTYCPPFRPLCHDEMKDIADKINSSNADIVWVGLSTPKQERWIDVIREGLETKVLLSVGAAFDFHTGRVPQAPAWVQRFGIEWFFRLTREPRRLWKRYAHNNPRFLWLAGRQLLGLKEF